MLLNQTSVAWTQEDQSWLGSAHGTDATRSVTLDTSAFTKATHYPNGYFLAGLAIAPIGGGSTLWGPAAADATDFGFLFTAVAAPDDDTIDIPAALLDHGRVIVSKLPIAVTGDSLTNPHFVFIA